MKQSLTNILLPLLLISSHVEKVSTQSIQWENFQGTVFRSNDGAKTWLQDSLLPKKIFWGKKSATLWSHDGGKTWTSSTGATPDFLWEKTYVGKLSPDSTCYRPLAVCRTTDDGYCLSTQGLGFTSAFYRISTEGNLIWKTYYGNMDSLLQMDIIAEEQGNILAFGTKFSSFIFQVDGYLYSLVLGSDGLPTFSHFEASAEGSLNGIQTKVRSRDGGFFIAYTRKIPSYNEGRVLTIIKTDSYGKRVQESDYVIGPNQKLIASSIIETMSGDVVVLATRTFLDEDSLSRSEATLVKVTTSGVLAWSKPYKIAPYESHGIKILESPDQQGFVILSYGVQKGVNKQPLQIFKTNSNGQLKWEKLIESKDYNYAEGLYIKSDGSINIGGSTASYADGNYVFNTKDFLFAKLDRDGNILKLYTWGNENTAEALMQLIEDSQGNTVICGYSGAANDLYYGGTLYVAKVQDAMSSVKTQLLPQPKLLVFPNPANKKVNIVLPPKLVSGDIEIINMLGMRIKRIKQNNDNNAVVVDIKDFPRGTYLICAGNLPPLSFIVE